MSTFSKSTWSQLKGVTADEIIKALKKDGWTHDVTSGAVQVFRKSANKRVTIHYHPKKTYQPDLIKAIISTIGWTEKEMKNLKLIK